jgi:lysophospholipase L1-like esterase
MRASRALAIVISWGLGACAAEPALVVAPDDAGALDAVAEAGPSAVDAGPADAAPPDAAPDGGQARPDVSPADAGAPDASDVVDAEPSSDAAVQDAGTTTVGIGLRCFADIYDPSTPGPDYDQFAPVVGSHCQGTNHQRIEGVERVVFLGDSVTVGTPPTVSGDYYRNRLAERLAQRFGLDAPGLGWRTVNLVDGRSYDQDSGDFATCAKWGARTDDLLGPNNQLERCFPAAELGKRTLVIMTMGGNDIAHLTKEGAASRTPPRTPVELQQETELFVRYLRDALLWLKSPGRFPNGVFVVFANPPEFTDGTAQVESCGLSTVAGFDDPWADPALLESLVIWALEQYMAAAVETQTDLVWMLEGFCGHGFVATGSNADPNNRCYRGPMTERWFDLTCIHPNPVGHGALADMFMAVVEE